MTRFLTDSDSIATSILCQENLLKTGIILRGVVAYFLSWAFPRKQQVQVKDPEAAEGWSWRRAAERRKRRSELLENAIKGQMLKIDQLGETIEEIPFSEEEGLDENLEKIEQQMLSKPKVKLKMRVSIARS